jgi:hypothetical protein
MEVEGRKGDTILTGADELYHDEAFRAKASPFPPIFNVNDFFEISICKPENFLNFPPPPYHSRWFPSQIRRPPEWPDQRMAVQQKAESAEKPHERTERQPEDRNNALVQGG